MVRDDYFDVVLIPHIKDIDVRKPSRNMISSGYKVVTYNVSLDF